MMVLMLRVIMILRLLQWQSRSGLPDDESSSEEEKEEEGSYNPMELDTAPSVSRARQPAEAAEADGCPTCPEFPTWPKWIA